MADIAGFSAAMKTKFIGPIRDMLHSNSILLFGLHDREDKELGMPHGSRDWKGIQADATGIDFVGNDFRMPLHSSRNQGTGPRTEGSTLPLPGRQGYKYLTDQLRYFYGTFNITGPLIKASEKAEGAFGKALELEMKGLTKDLKRHMNIQGYGDGTGVVATLATTANSATQVLDSTRWIQGGEFFDVYNGNTYIGAAAVSVLSVNHATQTVVFSAAVNGVTGYTLYRASSDSVSATPNNDKLSGGINGLENIIDSTGALHGLNPATAGEGFWASSEKAAGGALVGDDKLRELQDDIGFESGDDEGTVFITTRGIRTRYASTLTPLKQFTNAESVTMRGGFKALLFDDTPLMYDDHCKTGRIYAVDIDSMFWSQSSDWEWMEEDGKVLTKEARKDSYTGVLFKYCNLGTYARNRQGKITGAQDDEK